MTHFLDRLSHTFSVPARVPAALFALALGAVIVYGALFAQNAVAHKAFHDGRHVMNSPCH